MTGAHFRSPELWEKIIADTERGDHLHMVAARYGFGTSAFYEWRNSDPELKARYEAARIEGAHALAKGCLEIADDLSEEPASRKVRIWTRLQLLSRWFPKQYGEKVTQEITGPDGGPVQVTRIELVAPKEAE